jgi:endoglucanase
VPVGRSPRRRPAAIVAAAVVVAGLAAVGAGMAAAGSTSSQTATDSGIEVAGGRIRNLEGRPLQLIGVGRSGTEYECTGGHGVFAGPVDAAALLRWHVNAVRLPLNEDCWLGINGTRPQVSGPAYQASVTGYVRLLESRHIVVDIDLHWSAPGQTLARDQQEMPDADHSPAFWTSVARAFAPDRDVMFEPYNEPHGVSWSCWRDGCRVPGSRSTPAYTAVGMQELVDDIRSTGAANPIILDGLGRATDFHKWQQFRPVDPRGQLIAGWHTYYPPGCSEACWSSVVKDVGSTPLLVTELGQTDCGSAYVERLMTWLDARNVGYLAWAWDTWSGCHGPPLISSYQGTPAHAYGAAVMRHLQARGG